MHMYYDAFDMRDDHDIDVIFPEDAVPTQLNFQDLHEEDNVTEFPFILFQDWLVEGKFLSLIQSDAADDLPCVDIGWRCIIKIKK